jgi:hypothetical protein
MQDGAKVGLIPVMPMDFAGAGAPPPTFIDFFPKFGVEDEKL